MPLEALTLQLPLDTASASSHRYDRTMSFASYGHIVIASNSETGLFPATPILLMTCAYLELSESRNANASDEFFGKVDGHASAFGHSMGGGAGLLAAAADIELGPMWVWLPR